MRRPTSALAKAVLTTALAASTVSAQQAPPATDPGAGALPPSAAINPARGARHLLRNGWDYITYQEYERALAFFREAESRQAELTDPERTRLKQGIERAQRGLREVAGGMKTEPAYAMRNRTRPGAIAAAPATALAARDPKVEREPIQLAGAPAMPAANPNAANVRASDPAALASAAAAAAGNAPAPLPVTAPASLPPVPEVDANPAPPTATAAADPAAPAPLPAPVALAAANPAPAPVAAATTPEPAAPAPAAEPAPPAAPAEPPAAPAGDVELPKLPPMPGAELGAAAPPALPTPTPAPEAPAAPAEAPVPAQAPADMPTPAPVAPPVPTALPTPATLPAAEPAPAGEPLPTLPADMPPAGTPAPAEPAQAPAPTTPAPTPAPATPDVESLPALPGNLGEAPAPAPAAEPAPAPATPPALPAEPAPTPAPVPAAEPAPVPVVATAPSSAPAPAPAAVPDSPPAPEPPPAPPAEEMPAAPASTPAPAAAPVVSTSPGVVPGREALKTDLPPALLREVEEVAQRQDEERRTNPAPGTVPPDPNLVDGGANAGSPAKTALEISRAPSPTEPRPIRAIPVPEEFVPLPKREWQPNRKYWSAAATCHLPLYFQDASLERYGYSMEQRFGSAGRYMSIPLDDPRQSKQRNQIAQPFFSAGLFAAQIVLLPYNMIMDPPWEAEYDLGYYRPGDRVPTDVYYLPMTGVGPPLQGANYGKPAAGRPAMPAPRW